jgi:hypothetical protein
MALVLNNYELYQLGIKRTSKGNCQAEFIEAFASPPPE